MAKIFKIPFATQGDRTAVPDDVQADGSLSYTQGYGYDYERDQATDPAAKDIEREKMNSIFHDITGAVGEIQAFGMPVWAEEGKPYAIRSVVYHNKKAWQSKIENNNTEPAAGVAWTELKADVTAEDVGAYTKVEANLKFQPVGNYATKTEVGLKLDKAAVVQTPGASTTEVISQKAITDLLTGKVNFDDIVMELSDDWYKVPSVNLLDKELKKKASNTALTDGLAGKVDNATFSQEMTKKADKSSLGTAAGKDTGNSTGQIPDMSHFPFSGKGTDSIVVTLPNGLIIQSFKREVLSSVNVGESNAISINFPSAFPNKVIAVVCTKSSYVQIAISCENKTLSGFSAVAMKVVPADVTYSMADFIVLGY
ncbi:gp53-like domain-containing protein [Morganella morganii]|uniref:gp53-like domain-containing protein n=1 Tax=Morganella morganii TaxID=582 RepID=UPI00301C3E8C